MRVFKIQDGNVTELFDDESIREFSLECDWVNEGLFIADTEEDALRLADMHDKDLIDKDNVFYPDSYGFVIVAVKAE